MLTKQIEEDELNNKATIVFPNQLFKNHICITKNSHVVLIEDKRFF